MLLLLNNMLEGVGKGRKAGKSQYQCARDF